MATEKPPPKPSSGLIHLLVIKPDVKLRRKYKILLMSMSDNTNVMLSNKALSVQSKYLADGNRQ